MNNICTTTIVGGVARNIDIKQGTTTIGNFSIGWSTYQKGANERNEKSNYIDVTVFGKTAENLAKYLIKGCKVAVSGHLEQQSWTDQTGQQRSKHVVIADNIQILSNFQNNNGMNNAQQQGFNQPQQMPQQFQPQISQPQYQPNPQYQQMPQSFNPQNGMEGFPENLPF